MIIKPLAKIYFCDFLKMHSFWCWSVTQHTVFLLRIEDLLLFHLFSCFLLLFIHVIQYITKMNGISASSLQPNSIQKPYSLQTWNKRHGNASGSILAFQSAKLGLRFVLRLGVTFVLLELVISIQQWWFHLPESNHLFKVEMVKLVHNAYWLYPPNHKLLKSYHGEFC